MSVSNAAAEARAGRPVSAAPLRYYLWIAALFVLSRVAYALAGVRFQTSIVYHNFQFIDVQLLRDRLFESLLYFHEQPPLLNAILGALIHLFPGSWAGALHLLFIATGLGSAVLTFELMRRLAVRDALAAGLTIVFFISPEVVLSENFPMYEYLMMPLLLGSCAALYRLMARPGFWPSFGLFALLAALAWIRAIYHLYFLVLFAAGIALLLRGKRMPVLGGAAIPLAAVLALFLKNLVLFGFFGSSSWLGFNLATCTIHQLSMDERDRLIASGRLAPIARVEAPSEPEFYAPFIHAPRTGIPVLDREVKSSGDLNTNAELYFLAQGLYRKASLQVLRAEPKAYLRSVLIAWFCYFRPGTDFFQYDDLRRPIRGMDRVINAVFFGQFREASGTELRGISSAGHSLSLVLYTGAFLLVALPLLLGWSAWLMIRRPAPVAASRAQVALLALLSGHIVFIMGTCNFLSSFENNRYRFPTDCLYMILLAALIQFLWGRRAAGTSDAVPLPLQPRGN